MVENKSSLFGVIAIIIGASGLGLGAFSVVNFQVVEGPEGSPGQDGLDGVDGIDGFDGLNGTDGEDAPGGVVVAILDPDDGETVCGEVTIRAIVAYSENYTIIVLRNGTTIGTSIPILWDTTLFSEGWWNITVIVTDIKTNKSVQDTVIVRVKQRLFFEISGGTFPVQTKVYKNGNLVISCSRGLTLIVINRTTGEVLYSHSYDTFADTMESDELASELNNCNTSHIIVICSEDRWEVQATANLETALVRHGANNTTLQAAIAEGPPYIAYILIGYPLRDDTIIPEKPTGWGYELYLAPESNSEGLPLYNSFYLENGYPLGALDWY